MLRFASIMNVDDRKVAFTTRKEKKKKENCETLLDLIGISENILYMSTRRPYIIQGKIITR